MTCQQQEFVRRTVVTTIVLVVIGGTLIVIARTFAGAMRPDLSQHHVMLEDALEKAHEAQAMQRARTEAYYRDLMQHDEWMQDEAYVPGEALPQPN